MEQLTTVPLKSLSDPKCGRYSLFFSSFKEFNSEKFWKFSCTRNTQVTFVETPQL